MKNKLFFILALAVWAWPTPARAQTKAQPDSLEIPAPFVTDVTELLKGRVAGVDVISSVASPGMEPTVYVRGVGATPSSHPLYIVDGVRVHELENLSPDDIESVEALRDAAALTLYGPEAADGVIVVKTRRADRKGFHVSYGVQGLIQWPAWYPEGVSADEVDAYEDDCLTVADGTERSFSHKHHLALQYGGDRLKAYSGLSYLDHDGPMRGQEGFRRYTGSWSLSWTPARWITVETAGNYGRGDKSLGEWYSWNTLLRSSPMNRAEKRKEDYPYSNRRFSDILTGSSGVTVLPLPGLVLRAGGGFSRNRMASSNVSSWQEDGQVEFSGQKNGQTKWHWETEADYTVTLGSGHQLRAGLTYRQRTENYDLCSGRGSALSSETGVPYGSIPALLDSFIFPEMGGLCASDMKEWKHLLSISPYYWSWKWDEMSFRAGYAWRDIVHVDAAFLHATALGEEERDPLNGWSASGEWNLVSSFLDILPAWLQHWSLRGSWGQTDRMLESGPYRYAYLLHDGDKVSLIGSQLCVIGVPYREDVVRAVRREAGMDFGFGEQGEFTLSATRFWNDDDACVYIPNSFGGIFHPSYSILNRGWEFSGGWRGTAGDFRYAVGGNLTLYSNLVRMPEDNGSGFNWTENLIARDGYPVGVKWLFQFNPDHYSKEEPTYYIQPVDERPFYVGGAMPTVSAGLRAMVGWKQLSLSVSGHGMGGNSIVATHFYSALRRYYLDTYPDGGYYLMSTTAALFKGSFFRIDQIRLDYMFRSNLRLYASLDNWFLFTRYPGSDPEMALTQESFGLETATYPTSKRVVFGMEVGF